MKATQLFYAASAIVSTIAFPSFVRDVPEKDMAEVMDSMKTKGFKIEIPPRPTFTGLKRIPDAAHPWKAPGPNDARGPCPGLNTMANHGYLPRNGIATYAQLVTASVEALAFEYDFAAFVSAFSILIRGNSYEGVVSIGDFSKLVPPNPQGIDYPPKGLSAHGRFEGDDSILHLDKNIKGDAISFSREMFNTMKDYVKKYSKDGKDVDLTVFQELKWQNFQDMQRRNKKFALSPLRVVTIYNEAGFINKLFRNGKTGKLSLGDMESFFSANRFPKNFYRAAEPLTFLGAGASNAEIFDAHPIQPGKNNAEGVYKTMAYDYSNPCNTYRAFLGEIPVALNNATGEFAKNVDFFADLVHSQFVNFNCAKEKFTGTVA